MLESCCLISSEVIEEGRLGCAIELSTADNRLVPSDCGPKRGEPAPDGVGSEDAVVVSVC